MYYLNMYFLFIEYNFISESFITLSLIHAIQYMSIKTTGHDEQHTLTFKYQYGPIDESCDSIDGRLIA